MNHHHNPNMIQKNKNQNNNSRCFLILMLQCWMMCLCVVEGAFHGPVLKTSCGRDCDCGRTVGTTPPHQQRPSSLPRGRRALLFHASHSTTIATTTTLNSLISSTAFAQHNTTSFTGTIASRTNEYDENDTRPFVQRVSKPRPARRMNHAFRYLYRHDMTDEYYDDYYNDDDDKDNDSPSMKHWNSISANSTTNSTTTPTRDFLMHVMGYSEQDVHNMSYTFPPLLTLNVERHLRPKLRFLWYSVQPKYSSMQEIRTHVPPQFFGARLERTLAPRYAFLQHCQLVPGVQQMVQEDHKVTVERNGAPHQHQEDERQDQLDLPWNMTQWYEFLLACRSPKAFLQYCHSLQQKQQEKRVANQNSRTALTIELQDIVEFEQLFQRGLMPAARNETFYQSSRSTINSSTGSNSGVSVTSAQFLSLLIGHGANPLERDARGSSLLHWAAGTGSVDNVKVLVASPSTSFESTTKTSTERKNPPGGIISIWDTTHRDGATPLHWAAAGVTSRHFGTGGHVDVCRYLLNQAAEAAAAAVAAATETAEHNNNRNAKAYVNALTKDGNSALMWAAWAGCLPVCKLLVRHCADASVTNRNGCTVAHWAASGGSLECCQYLHDTVGVDFSIPNVGGNTPLTHAVAFGRAEIVEWLRSSVLTNTKEYNDDTAASLAKNFCDWTQGDERRLQVLALFEDWYGTE